MEVKLDKRYPVKASIEQCWAVLGDVRTVAGCMPGAQITEQLDDTHFKGSVKSKVGPAVMSFSGDIELQGRDEAARSLRLLGKGADKAGSSASMQLTAHLEPDEAGGGSVLAGVATIVVSGKLAQFGSRLLVPVSDAMLAQFADNFRAAAAAVPGGEPTTEPAVAPATATEPAPPDATKPTPSVASADGAHTEGGAHAAAASAPAAAPNPSARATPVSPPVPQPVKELNALALMWTVIKDLVAGLFRRKP
jgi:carbon monoxide dehydrogenase subunit G